MRTQLYFKVSVAFIYFGGCLLGGSAVLLAWTLADDGNLFVAITNLVVGIGMSIVGLIHVTAARRQLELSVRQGEGEAA